MFAKHFKVNKLFIYIYSLILLMMFDKFEYKNKVNFEYKRKEKPIWFIIIKLNIQVKEIQKKN